MNYMKIKEFFCKNKDLFINFLVMLLQSISKLQSDEQAEKSK